VKKPPRRRWYPGVHDYVMKGNLARLVPAFRRELREAESRKERKRAEEKLKSSEERFRSIFENAVEGMYQTTPEGRYLAVNPALVRMLGYEAPEELMMRVTDVGRRLFVSSEDRERYLTTIEQNGVIEGFEVQVYRKDESILWTSTSARAIRDAAGNICRFEGTVEDISLRKQAEKNLKQTLEQLRKSLIGAVQAMSAMTESSKTGVFS
jgi:PAS domain S-box-containing protein